MTLLNNERFIVRQYIEGEEAKITRGRKTFEAQYGSVFRMISAVFMGDRRR